MYMKGTKTQRITGSVAKIGSANNYQDASAGTNPKTQALVVKKIVIWARKTTGAYTITLNRYDTPDPASASKTTFTPEWVNTTPMFGPYEIELGIDFPYGGDVTCSDATNLVADLVYVPIKVNPDYEQPGTYYP